MHWYWILLSKLLMMLQEMGGVDLWHCLGGKVAIAMWQCVPSDNYCRLRRRCNLNGGEHRQIERIAHARYVRDVASPSLVGGIDL